MKECYETIQKLILLSKKYSSMDEFLKSEEFDSLMKEVLMINDVKARAITMLGVLGYIDRFSETGVSIKTNKHINNLKEILMNTNKNVDFSDISRLFMKESNRSLLAEYIDPSFKKEELALCFVSSANFSNNLRSNYVNPFKKNSSSKKEELYFS
ncbi:MAG: hypothetical protein WCR30_03450 [Clostridia bacterium]